MLMHLHKQATTTPKVRAAIQASGAPASVLAERFGTTEQTICKWRHRDSVHDRSHHCAPAADHPDPGTRGRRGCAAQDIARVAG